MPKLTLDRETSAKLQGLTGRVELCDDSGRTLGYFTPVTDRSPYEGVEIPISEEELRRREQGTVWYSTEEVRAHLKNLEGAVMFSVRWVPEALNELAAIWVQASDRTMINAAVDRIDHRLRRDPEGESESRDAGRRILLDAPLGVLFTVQPDDRTVSVLTIWRYDRRP